MHADRSLRAFVIFAQTGLRTGTIERVNMSRFDSRKPRQTHAMHPWLQQLIVNRHVIGIWHWKSSQISEGKSCSKSIMARMAVLYPLVITRSTEISAPKPHPFNIMTRSPPSSSGSTDALLPAGRPTQQPQPPLPLLRRLARSQTFSCRHLPTPLQWALQSTPPPLP